MLMRVRLNSILADLFWFVFIIILIVAKLCIYYSNRLQTTYSSDECSWVLHHILLLILFVSFRNVFFECIRNTHLFRIQFEILIYRCPCTHWFIELNSINLFVSSIMNSYEWFLAFFVCIATYRLHWTNTIHSIGPFSVLHLWILIKYLCECRCFIVLRSPYNY